MATQTEKSQHLKMSRGPGQPPVVDRIAGRIRSAIARGTLAPGQRLVEAELTAEFGVSRASVREALTRLAAEGIVDYVRNRGAIVHRMSRRDVRELFEVREVLEGLAARLAAARLDKSGMRPKIEAALARATGPKGGIDPEVIRDIYDEMIMAITDNKLLREQLARLRAPLLRVQFVQHLKTEQKAQFARDYEAILRAIVAGDDTRAERVTRAHVRTACRATMEFGDELFGL
jgi:DNA-binding GntR family transcriptional regulator